MGISCGHGSGRGPARLKRAPPSRPWYPGRRGVRENPARVTNGSGRAGTQHSISADLRGGQMPGPVTAGRADLVHLRWGSVGT